MARAFILAEGPQRALGELRAMRDRSTGFTVDLLGEAAVSEREAEAYATRYLELIEVLADAASKWPRSEHLDSDDRGPIPAVNVSVKDLGVVFPDKNRGAGRQHRTALRPTAPAAAPRKGAERLCQLRHGDAFAEGLTLRLFKALLDAEEFNDYPHAGIAIQAYLRDTPDDVEQLIEWAAKRRTRVTVRLVKGAYWDTETILARQRRWPVPVYEHKQETDAGVRAAGSPTAGEFRSDRLRVWHSQRPDDRGLSRRSQADRSAASAARVSGALRNGGADQGGP